MRTGLGLAVIQKIEYPIESTTFAAVNSAVVDALLSAAGIFSERSSLMREETSAFLKQIELRLHYDGFEIQNLDLTLTVRQRLPDTLLDSINSEIRKPLFLNKDQLTVKQYVIETAAHALQVQALALIG
ncbi:hypothetical protein DRI50_07090 [candidate division KSB1 bacterium]|nr:MAG: hypothetical protein DRI50_07090 [candidate division KSB1 bacterium]